MKTYDEMTRCALEARDEHEKKRKRRIYIAQRAVAAAAGVFAAFIIGFGIRNNYKKSDTFRIPDNTVENAAATTVSTELTHSKETTITTHTTITAAVNKTTTQKSTQTTVVSSLTASVQTQQTSSTNKAAEAAVTEHTTEYTTASAAPITSTVTTVLVNDTTVTTTADDRPSSVSYTGGATGETGGASGGEGSGDMCTGGGCGPSAGSSDMWYSLPLYQAYEEASIDGYAETYYSGYRISSELIGGNIAAAKMKSGYPVDGVVRTCFAYAYYINGLSSENAVAIKFDGQTEYYLYLTDDMDLDNIKKQIPPLE